MINKDFITHNDSPWHKDCFTCYNCDKILSGEKATSRDDKLYCADCFGERFPLGNNGEKFDMKINIDKSRIMFHR